uniref:Uncharacterized protein n=1 Tax=Oryza glumipatula TaxID=40148 RepID=A0A0D9ZZ30_9ORYZ
MEEEADMWGPGGSSHTDSAANFLPAPHHAIDVDVAYIHLMQHVVSLPMRGRMLVSPTDETGSICETLPYLLNRIESLETEEGSMVETPKLGIKMKKHEAPRICYALGTVMMASASLAWPSTLNTVAAMCDGVSPASAS